MKTVLFKNPALAHTGRALSHFVALDRERERIEWREKQQREIQAITEGQFLKGKEEGKIEGKIEGKEEGKEEGIIGSIVKLLENRFQRTVPDEIQQKLLAIRDSALLDELLLDTVSAPSLEDFSRKIDQRVNKTSEL